MDLSPYRFELPQEQIALRPVVPRDAARLLVVRGDGELEDHYVRDLPDLLSADDVLVFNDTRVLPAALKAVRRAREHGGSDVEVNVNLVEPLGEARWRALARPGKRLRPGDRLEIAAGFWATILQKFDTGAVELALTCEGMSVTEALDAHGDMPLPPYIARRRAADQQDRTDYQTKFATGEAASVAAPTAGLHFTEALLEKLTGQGQMMRTVSLHVGQGTFAPLSEHHWAAGRLHAEWRSIGGDVAQHLNQDRAAGKRIIPVGTTAMRTLESAITQGEVQAVEGPTDIFIRPGDAIGLTGGLMTNFHLPESSLFMLVCALMGTNIMQAAYAHAIRSGYRFYSYGDACLLLP